MLTRSQIERWQPKPLLGMADHWARLSAHIEEKFDQLAHEVTKAGNDYWEGTAADAAQESVAEDRRTALDIADALSALADRARQAYHEIDSSLDLARGAIAAAEEAQFEVTEKLVLQNFTGSVHSDVYAIWTELQNALIDAAQSAKDTDERASRDLTDRSQAIRTTFGSALTTSHARAVEDAAALAAGSMDSEQLGRLVSATTLAPRQLIELQAGDEVTIPSAHMDYLSSISRALDGSSPQEIERIMRSLPPDGQRALANSLQMVSTSKIVTPSGASGGFNLLPESLRSNLSQPGLVGETTRLTGGNNDTQPLKQITHKVLNSVPENQAIAAIVAQSDPDYQAGSDLDSKLLEAAEKYLAAEIENEESRGEIGITHHRATEVTAVTGPMFEAVAQDKIVVEAAFRDPNGGQELIMNLMTRQWEDDGAAVSKMFTPDGSGIVTNPDDSAQLARAERTGNIMEQVAKTASTPESWQKLGNVEGTDRLSVGQVNPVLLRQVADGLSPYLTDLAGMDQPDRPGFDVGDWADPGHKGHYQGSARVVALMNTDEEAGANFTGSAYEAMARLESSYARDPLSSVAGFQLTTSGVLQGISDHGLRLAAQDLYDNDAERLQAQYANKSSGYDLARDTLLITTGGIPYATAIADATLNAVDDPLRSAFIGDPPTGIPETAKLQGPDFSAREYRAIFEAEIPDIARQKYSDLFQSDGSLLPYEKIMDENKLRNDVQSVFNLIGADHEGHGNNMRNAYNDVVDYPG